MRDGLYNEIHKQKTVKPHKHLHICNKMASYVTLEALIMLLM